jgi:hypothetical protein
MPTDPTRRFSPLEILVLAFLAARLLAWAFLLPSWNGFDEPFHQGYVEVCAESPRWHAFQSAALPERLLEGMRGWPLFPKYAEQFGARAYGEAVARPAPVRSPDRNYEMLQSPAYYVLAGLLLRSLPRMSPIAELYLLRCGNALLAFLTGVVTLVAARRIGLGRRAWMATAMLAFVPGFSLALVRVSNDALCAFLLAIAVGLSLAPRDDIAWRPVASSAAAGLAPWAKLYGLAGIPALAIDALRRGERNRVARLALLLVPSAALAYFSRRINGSAVSLLEILSHPKPAAFLEVPWLRDAWTVAKTHLWVSGMSSFVFPNAVYVVLLAGLGLCAALTVRRAVGRGDSISRQNLFQIVSPIVFFLVALGYFAWKNFARFRAPGGAGGWYLWAMALPEALLLTWGLAGGAGKRTATLIFAAFFLLTIAGDLALFGEVSGRLLTGGGNAHIRGIRSETLSEVWTAFLRSRPAGAAGMATAFVPISWLLGIVVLTAGARQGNPPEPRPS